MRALILLSLLLLLLITHSSAASTSITKRLEDGASDAAQTKEGDWAWQDVPNKGYLQPVTEANVEYPNSEFFNAKNNFNAFNQKMLIKMRAEGKQVRDPPIFYFPEQGDSRFAT